MVKPNTNARKLGLREGGTPEEGRVDGSGKFSTSSGVFLDSPHDSEDMPENSLSKNIGTPGTFPYTRGIHPEMYRSRLWTMRQYTGFGTARETNERFHYLLSQGQQGISVAFDLPTQIGFDPDHPLAFGEVGKVGVSIASLEDMEILLEGLPLDKISTSMTINATAPILLCFYLAVAEKRGVPFELLKGTVQNDILKEYIARGTYIFPPDPSMRLVTDTISFCKEMVPKWNAISISGYHIREAGSTAVQEVAFTLASGISYVKAAIDVGLDVDEIASQLSFFFNVHNNFSEEIAKFRAARRLWAKTMRSRFGARSDKACMLRFHAQTAGSSLTAQQPKNNVVRVAIQAMSAILGGTQSLHTNSMDEALALPTNEAVRIALRTQQILAEESQITGTVDPCAGAYGIEALTDEIESRAVSIIEEIDEMGGMLRAIETGWVQREIEESAYKTQCAVDKGEKIVVGVNQYTVEQELSIPTLQVRREVEGEQCRRLEALHQMRDSEAVSRYLDAIRDAALNGENVLPRILDAVRIHATLGEISEVLRGIFGIYQESVNI